MKYKNITFDAVVATPGCGKSFLCDKYSDKFVDVDELKLKLKYFVPENITREELEKTKGERPFEKRAKTQEVIDILYKRLDEIVKDGKKILICAPHPEVIDYLVSRNIKFVFVFPSHDMKEELKRRMVQRGNPKSMIEDNENKFEEFYKSNKEETKSAVKYEFKKDEYLEDIIRSFGYNF